MMSTEEKREFFADREENILLAEGFDDAIIGYAQRFNDTFALYDREKCIGILMTRDGMSREEAEEYFEFNVTGAWVGDATPAFATLFDKAEE